MASVVALIGVSAYRLSDDGLPALPQATAGVVALGRALARRLDGRPSVRRLVDPPDAAAIEAFAAEAAAAATDLLLVYYCGHGIVDGAGALSLTHTGSDVTAAPDRDLPYTRLRDLIATSPARRRVLVLDCCYRGAGSTALLAGDRLRVPGGYLLTSTSTGRWEHTTPAGQAAALTERLVEVLRSDGPDTLDAVTARLGTSMRAGRLPAPLVIDDRGTGALPIFRDRPVGAVPVPPAPTRRPAPTPAARAAPPPTPPTPTPPTPTPPTPTPPPTAPTRPAASGPARQPSGVALAVGVVRLFVAFHALYKHAQAANRQVPINPGPSAPPGPHPAAPGAHPAAPGAWVPPRGPDRSSPRRPARARVRTAWVIAVAVLACWIAVDEMSRGATQGSDPAASSRVPDRYAAAIYVDDGQAVAIGGGTSRSYPFGDTYADITGYQTLTRATGLERLTATGPVHTGIRPAAQEAAVTALGHSDGAVVAIDATSGQILALAGWPRPDPNAIALLGDREVSNRSTDPDRPLVNRATAWPYPAGPVLSLVTAAAALNTGSEAAGAVTALASYRPPGPTTNTTYTTTDRACTNPPVSLADAVAWRCQPALARLGVGVGGTALSETAARFGLAGMVPDLGLEQQSPSLPLVTSAQDEADFATGRGRYEVTVLQAAEVVAAIANHGALAAPHVRAAPPPTAYRRALPPEGANGLAGALGEAGSGALTGCVPGQPSTAGPTCWHLAWIAGTVVAVAVEPDELYRGRSGLAAAVAQAVLDAIG
jgi:penicillin-binding protein A